MLVKSNERWQRLFVNFLPQSTTSITAQSCAGEWPLILIIDLLRHNKMTQSILCSTPKKRFIFLGKSRVTCTSAHRVGGDFSIPAQMSQDSSDRPVRRASPWNYINLPVVVQRMKKRLSESAAWRNNETKVSATLIVAASALPRAQPLCPSLCSGSAKLNHGKLAHSWLRRRIFCRNTHRREREQCHALTPAPFTAAARRCVRVRLSYY